MSGQTRTETFPLHLHALYNGDLVPWSAAALGLPGAHEDEVAPTGRRTMRHEVVTIFAPMTPASEWGPPAEGVVVISPWSAAALGILT